MFVCDRAVCQKTTVSERYLICAKEKQKARIKINNKKNYNQN